MPTNYVVSASQPRWVLLHYHIFKNAGSTIEYFLQRTFGEMWATLNGPDPGSVLKDSDIAEFLGLHPELLAISSHHLRYPKPVIPGTIIFDLCFLREPLQRLWSMYQYLRRTDSVDDLGDYTKSLDARRFFEQMIEEHPELVNDSQVCLLGNRGEYTRPPAEPDLRNALNVMREMSVIGVVDCFDESALAAEYFLRPVFPGLQFQYVKQNVAPQAESITDLGHDHLRRRVGEHIYDQLERMNRLDTQLLAAARDEVFRRFEMLPSRDARIADFRERCRTLQVVHEGETIIVRR